MHYVQLLLVYIYILHCLYFIAIQNMLVTIAFYLAYV